MKNSLDYNQQRKLKTETQERLKETQYALPPHGTQHRDNFTTPRRV